MFSAPIKTSANRSRVAVLAGDEALARRVKAALDASGRYQGEIGAGPIGHADAGHKASLASLHVVEVPTQDANGLAELSRHMEKCPVGTPVIVVSTDLAEKEARQFLKLGIADWLPRHCTDEELVNACDQALRPKTGNGAVSQAHCIAFMSAIGGAGATTLSLVAGLAFAAKGAHAPPRACAIDFDFQRGTLAEYANVLPALQLDEIASRPERLDRHLLEIMLTRGANGLAILSAPASLTNPHAVKTAVIGRLLDLAAAEFEQLVLDLPSCWNPWCEDIVRGLDRFYIVTEPTVTGLRQARRLAENIQKQCDYDLSGAVIVNKSWRFGSNVSRRQARGALGPLLAGFITDGGNTVRRVQDRGVMLQALKPRTRIARDVRALLAQPDTRPPDHAAIARSALP